MVRNAGRQAAARSLISLSEGPMEPTEPDSEATSSDLGPDPTEHTAIHGRRKLDEMDPSTLTARQGYKLAQAMRKKARAVGNTGQQPPL